MGHNLERSILRRCCGTLSAMEEGLELDFDGDFAVIRMTKGENRFRLSTIHAWNKVLDDVLRNEDVKGLLITGKGRFFSNGIDLTWLTTQQGDTPRKFLNNLSELLKRVMVFPVPTAAVMNGHAFGAGAFLALSCDYRVMRPDKGWLNWPETVLGMRFGQALFDLARTKIPPGLVQREALLFAKRLTGDNAKYLGLVDCVTEEDKMMEEAKKLIKQALGKNGLDRKALGIMKKDIYGQHLDFSKL